MYGNFLSPKFFRNAIVSDDGMVIDKKFHLSGNADNQLTDSELVRKYVTFHFYFPTGMHHPHHHRDSPKITRQNGLLSYKANCDKVC